MAICKNSREKIELVVMDDASSDGTTKLLLTFLPTLLNETSSNFCSNLTGVKFTRSRISIFETMCEQQAIYIATAPVIITFQSDMIIRSPGFDSLMINALRSDSELFLLSARGVAPTEVLRTAPFIDTYRLLQMVLKRLANLFFQRRDLVQRSNIAPTSPPNSNDLFNLIFPLAEQFVHFGSAGFRGELLQKWNENLSLEGFKIPDDKIWIGTFPMRGPCVFFKEKFLEVGGFNTKAFFLGLDDGDICLRAQIQKGWRSGFYPLNFTSPLRFGTTRKPRSSWQKFLIFVNMLLKSRQVKKSVLYQVYSKEEDFRIALPEVRTLPIKAVE